MSKTIKGLMQKIDGSMENFIRDLRYIKVNQVAILEIKNKMVIRLIEKIGKVHAK